MLENWLFVGLLVLVAALLPAMPIIIARFIAPRKPNAQKMETYECGVETVGDTWVQFKVQYYIYALLFVIFDIETVFLYPWAVAFNRLGLFAFVEMMIFLIILVGGLVYAWRKGVLEWV